MPVDGICHCQYGPLGEHRLCSTLQFVGRELLRGNGVICFFNGARKIKDKLVARSFVSPIHRTVPKKTYIQIIVVFVNSQRTDV